MTYRTVVIQSYREIDAFNRNWIWVTYWQAVGSGWAYVALPSKEDLASKCLAAMVAQEPITISLEDRTVMWEGKETRLEVITGIVKP